MGERTRAARGVAGHAPSAPPHCVPTNLQLCATVGMASLSTAPPRACRLQGGGRLSGAASGAHLEDEAKVPLLHPQGRDLLVVKEHAPRGGLLQPRNQAQQRGLACGRGWAQGVGARVGACAWTAAPLAAAELAGELGRGAGAAGLAGAGPFSMQQRSSAAVSLSLAVQRRDEQPGEVEQGCSEAWCSLKRRSHPSLSGAHCPPCCAGLPSLGPHPTQRAPAAL